MITTWFDPLLMNGEARSPFESHKKAHRGFVEWRQYMLEMRNSVQSQIELARQKDDPYFLGKSLGGLNSSV